MDLTLLRGSEGLSREYIEKELAVIYDNKPTKDEAVIVREGKLPHIYAQRVDKEGNTIQSCISYIPKDYTGERTSYLVHSLVLSNEEKNAVFNDLENAALNSEMFIDDFSKVDIENSDKYPDNCYPSVGYIAKKSDSVHSLADKYSSKALKFMIYAVINLLYGKYRAIFPVLPVTRDELSGEALSFMNTFVQIMPYHVRPQLSFVTDAGDITKFTSFKIRFLPENSQITAGKGVGIVFRNSTAIGIREEDVSSNIQLVDFFYGLLTNDAMRREFLLYVDRAVKKNSKLAVMNEKNLSSLVFLFMQCSGMYDESSVIPNDSKMEEFIAIYDKYRSALSDEYRINALKSLERYPANHSEIPKKVFSKITRFYSTEPEFTKRIIMNVVLDLIHTDIMREKLFTFIKGIYADESAEMRSLINSNLASVYYGGFLQSAIFNFFAENFTSEPVETRDVIIEKFLLTVRTPTVQKQIITFFDDHYFDLTDAQKDRFYEMFFRMLPECDGLSENIVNIVNKKLPDETPEVKKSFNEGIYKAVENDQHRKNPKLFEFIMSGRGYCTDCVISGVFTVWIGSKIFDKYFDFILQKPITDLADHLVRMWQTVSDIADEAFERLETEIFSYFKQEDVRYDLFDLIKAEEAIECAEQNCSKQARRFYKDFIERCLHPHIELSVNDAFLPRHRAYGTTQLAQYAERHTYISEAPEYAAVKKYFDAEHAVCNFESEKLLSAVMALPQESKLRTNIAECLKASLPKINTPDDKQASAIVLSLSVFGFLSSGRFDFKASCDALRDLYELPQKRTDKVIFYNELRVMTSLLRAADLVCKYTGNAEMVCGDGSDLGSVLTEFIQKYPKQGSKWLINTSLSMNLCDELSRFCRAKVNECSKQKTGIFQRIIKKKT